MRPVQIAILFATSTLVLTGCGGSASNGSPSPDTLPNNSILLVSDPVTTIDTFGMSSGSRQPLLTAAASGPSISPNRNLIAYTVQENNKSKVYIANVDGTNPHKISVGDFDDDTPSFNSDGTRIFVDRDTDGTNNRHIFSMNLSGGEVEQHTFATAGTLPHDFRPALNPSGTRIAFERSSNGGPTTITTCNLDGSDPIDLTPISAKSPAWSPTGNKVAYIDTSNSNTDSVTIMNADGTNKTVIATFTGSIASVSWSPDGSQLVYDALGASTSFEFQIFVVNADGTGNTQKTFDTTKPAFQPSWSRN